MGRFFNCYILLVNVVDFMVEAISNPWIFLDWSVFNGDGLEMFNTLMPLN